MGVESEVNVLFNLFHEKNRRRVASFLLAAFCCSFWPMAEARAADAPSISAPAAIEMDFETGAVLYGKDEDVARPVASLTKMMTALLIYEGVRDGRWTWGTRVPVSEANRAYAANDPCGAKLKMGETESLRELTDLTLVLSSNAAARILAEFAAGSEEAFVVKMNERARALGIEARYGDAAGLKWNMVTPRANALLMKHFLEAFPEVTMTTSRSQLSFKGKTFYNVNLLYTRIPTPGADGFKSGWMPFSGYCFAGTAKRDGHRVLTVVMKAPTYEGSYRDSRTLLNDAFRRRATLATAPAVTAEPEPVTAPTPAAAKEHPEIPDAIEGVEDEALPAPEEATVVPRPLASFKTSSWAAPTIEKATARGLSMQERRGGSAFEGQAPLTRAEFIAILMAALAPEGKPAGEGHFQDITPGDWYADAVQLAWEAGVTNGVAADRFDPEAIVSREQMAALLVKGLRLRPTEQGLVFRDAHRMTPNMKSSIQTVVARRLMVGTAKDRFAPKDLATREQATIIVYRLLRQIDAGAYANPLAERAAEA